MPSLIHLRRKIKSVKNTRQITRAMQMVAASKMRRAQEAALGTRAYAEEGQTILARLQAYLAKQSLAFSHPLLVVRPVERIALVVIASDKGLAGGYNSNVIRQALLFLEENKDKQVEVISVGRKAQDNLVRLGITPVASFNDFASRPTSKDILPIAQLTIRAFLNKSCDQVSIISTKFHSTLRQTAEASQLLPVVMTANEEPTVSQVEPYIFEPAAKTVLETIVPRLVEVQLLQKLLDAIASEHSARMIAMKNATDNASQLLDDLGLTYNSVRQANITREIAEISAGAS